MGDDKSMKDESVSALLASGEIQMTDDVLFMIDTITAMIDRGCESDTSGQFLGYAMQLLEVWRTSLATNDDKMEASDTVMNMVMGRISPTAGNKPPF